MGGLVTSTGISIHALREEGDTTVWVRATLEATISIHALREEGDAARHTASSHVLYFNPRPPRGGRLNCNSFLLLAFLNFNPRPPRGGRLSRAGLLVAAP